MRYINIITTSNTSVFLDQWDTERFPSNEYMFVENSHEDRVWDAVVIYEDLKDKLFLKYRAGNLFYFSGEPPTSRQYPSSFLNQFDVIYTSHTDRKKNVVNRQQCLPWFFGFSFKQMKHKYSFADIKNMPIPQKHKLISVVASNKQLMPGHHQRFTIVQHLMKDYSDVIDFYGRGFNFADDKGDALLNYKFHICIENSCINDYWTEKFADPVLAYAVPLYAGCRNIDSYFNSKGYYTFDVNNYSQLSALVERILLDGDKLYEEMLPALAENRNRIMDEYNLIPTVANLITDNDTVMKTTLFPARLGWDYKFISIKLRLSRYLYRFYYKFLGC